MAKIETGLRAAGSDLKNLTVDELAPVDEFHTRGRESTRELATLAEVKASDIVLDVGCGLGGTARHLANQHQCSVMGVDLTQEFVDVGRQLTELVGLADRVSLQQGSALDLPYADRRFDVVVTEHVQMNIADKPRFYREIARVLKPGGRFLFHDVFRGDGEPPIYPTPWAADESLSSLATVSDARSMMEASSLKLTQMDDKVQESIAFFQAVGKRLAQDGPPPLGVHLLMGENAKEKIQNYMQGLAEGRLTVGLGMAIKV